MEAYGLEPQVGAHGAVPRQLGRHRDERVARQLHRARTRTPEEQFGKTMRIPDELLDAVVPARHGARGRARRRPARGEARARALHRPRAHGDEEAAERGRGALHARRPRGHEAPEDVPEAPLPDGDPVHLPALLVEHLGIGSTSEARRLIAQGGVKLDGEPVTELDVPRARLEGRVAPGREAPLRALPRRLTQGSCCYYSPAARQGGVESPCNSRQLERLRAKPDTTVPTSIRSLCASQRLFYAVQAAPVFENSTA